MFYQANRQNSVFYSHIGYSYLPYVASIKLNNYRATVDLIAPLCWFDLLEGGRDYIGVMLCLYMVSGYIDINAGEGVYTLCKPMQARHCCQ